MKKTLLMLCALSAFTAETAKKPEVKAAPVITLELEAEIWRAQTRLLSAKIESDASEAEVKAKLDQASRVCGEDYALSDDRVSRRLKCVLKEKSKTVTGRE